MNRSAIKTIVYIFKYLSIITFSLITVICSDILSSWLPEEVNSFLFEITTNLKQTNSIFIILVICLLIWGIANAIIHYFKMDEDSIALKQQECLSNNKISACDQNYKLLIQKTDNVNSKLSTAEKELYKNTYRKVDVIKEHCIKIEYHYENRKCNYVNTNRSLYGIVKTSKNLDVNTLKLVKQLDKNLT